MENIMDRVLYERKGHVGIINLDFVSDLNYCDILGYKAINEAILRLRDDEDVWAADELCGQAMLCCAQYCGGERNHRGTHRREEPPWIRKTSITGTKSETEVLSDPSTSENLRDEFA